MASSIIRIDPTLPVCWESVDTIRIGFDRAEVRLHSPSARAQRMISLLRAGVPRAGIAAAARSVGLRARERGELLDLLSPVLLRDTVAHWAPPRLEPVAVLGDDTFSALLRHRLAAAGLIVAEPGEDSDDAPGETPGFAVVVERFLGPATLAQPLLIEGVPHLPVRPTDRSMWVGPLVLPGGAPCLACVELQRIEDDPLAAALAAQLLGEAPGAATPACADVAAALVVALLRRYRIGPPELVDRRLRFSVRDGMPEVLPVAQPVRPHPDCACVSLAQDGADDQMLGGRD